MGDQKEKEDSAVVSLLDDEGEGSTFSSVTRIAPQEDELLYAWDSINVWSSNPRSTGKLGKKTPPKQILDNVTGAVRSGQLLALMGASGAGKTTLLNVLHFNSGSLHVEGDRCINGVPTNSAQISTASAYVQQEDLFIPTLTVREHLIFTSRVRISRKISAAERLRRVEQVIHDLGLTKCQNTKIGDPATSKGISGGEMKRLAFASEYITDPAILFCDEPTSGLDSFMAQSVVEVMQKMAKEGKSIICTIHQPASEVFEMFDHIYLLSGGRVAFAGRVNEALDFFDKIGHPCPLNHNPADFFIFSLAIVPGDEENCRARTRAICDAFATCPKNEQIQAMAKWRSPDAPKQHKKMMQMFCGGTNYRTNLFIQFWALLRRSTLCIFRDPMLLWARLICIIFIALLVSLVFYNQKQDQAGVKNINGSIIIANVMLFLACGLSIVFVLCEEAPIFLREHWNGMYRTDVYYVAKVLAELPFLVFFACLYMSICYYLIGLRKGLDHFLWANAISIMAALVSSSFGYMMSTSLRRLTVALAAAPSFMIALLTYSGFFLRDESAPDYMQWIKFLSWFYYGIELMFINQYDGMRTIAIDRERPLQVQLPNGAYVLQFFSFKPDHWERNFILMGVLWFCFHVIAFLFLLKRTYSRV